LPFPVPLVIPLAAIKLTALLYQALPDTSLKYTGLKAIAKPLKWVVLKLAVPMDLL